MPGLRGAAVKVMILGNGRAGSRWGRLARKLDHAVSLVDIREDLSDFQFDPIDADAIIVATPPEEHFASVWHCRQFFPRSPILVEKPLDVSLDHADEWVGLRPWYVAQWRYHRMTDDLMGRISPGVANHLRLTYRFDNGRDDPIMTSAVHDLDLACWIRGESLDVLDASITHEWGTLISLSGSVTIEVDHVSPVRRRVFRLDRFAWVENPVTDLFDDADGDDADEPYRRLLADFLSPTPSAKLPTVADGLRALTMALRVKDILNA